MTERFVSGEGPLDCQIAFVGEAPGAQEDRLLRPFVGISGQLFDRLLRGAGIIRKHCYITNVIKVRPPKNNISVFLDLNKKVPIETDTYKSSVEYLKEELAKCKANVIVAVGATSLWALCGLKAITKRRGSIYESTLLPGRKVIPLIHPSAALRQYIFQHYITFDLLRIKEEAKTPNINKPQENLIVANKFTDAKNAITDFVLPGELAFDIEVVNEEVSCISLADDREAYCIPFGNNFTLEEEAEIWDIIAGILEDPLILKIGQNLTFDSTFLFRKYGIRVTNISDTMVAQALVNPDFPKALDFIVSIYTRHPYYKDDLKKYVRGYADQRTFWEYNARDSAVCIEAMPSLMKDLETLGNREVFETQCRLIEPLVYMAERGIKVDKKGMQAESRRIEEEVADLQEQLNSVAGEDLNVNSHKQLKEYFYIKKGIAPYKSRTGMNRGSITVDKNALKRISRRGFEEAKLILRIRGLLKQKSTYLDINLAEGDRMKCSFNPVGGDGRLSSSKNIFDEGGNLQNIPHPILKFYLADEGYITYNADLSQADARVVAYIAPEPKLIEVFESGADIHLSTASLIFDIPIEEVSREEGTCPICDDPEMCGHEGQRFWAKKANHSFNYGLGAEQFSFLFEIPKQFATNVRRKYLLAYPGLENYWNWVQDHLRVNRCLTDCYGWTRRFMNRWGNELFKQAYSFIPRASVAAKINRDGVIAVWNDPELEKVELQSQVHDSIVFQIPISAGWDYHIKALTKIKENLEKPLKWKGREFVIPAEIKGGLNLGNTKKLTFPIKEEQIKGLTDGRP